MNDDAIFLTAEDTAICARAGRRGNGWSLYSMRIADERDAQIMAARSARQGADDAFATEFELIRRLRAAS